MVLIPLIDEMVETSVDEFGDKKFNSRKDVVDEAIKDFVRLKAPEILESLSLLEVPIIE